MSDSWTNHSEEVNRLIETSCPKEPVRWNESDFKFTNIDSVKANIHMMEAYRP